MSSNFNSNVKGIFLKMKIGLSWKMFVWRMCVILVLHRRYDMIRERFERKSWKWPWDAHAAMNRWRTSSACAYFILNYANIMENNVCRENRVVRIDRITFSAITYDVYDGIGVSFRNAIYASVLTLTFIDRHGNASVKN